MTDDLSSHLQSFFRDGLVTLIGAGYSASHGLPTMPQLATELCSRLPSIVNPAEASEWKPIDKALKGGENLERVLDAISHDDTLVRKIIEVSSSLIATRELEAIGKICAGEERLALEDLIPILATNGEAQVVTTNYDRLVELACERSGLFIDSGFVGANYGTFDPTLSRDSLRTSITKRGSKYSLRYRPHVVLSKPHGSLDWYLSEEQPLRSAIPLPLPRLMITPGAAKYRKGYEPPFDHHIHRSNQAIERASRVFAIGFGFNDPHLQTHLAPKIRSGLPCLVITRTVSESAHELLTSSPSMTAIERLPTGGSRVYRGTTVSEHPDFDIWHLEHFIDALLT